jgi:uroporphyrinogen-III synthase
MRVLITRPEPDATMTAQRVEALGHEPITAPLTQIVPTGSAIPVADYTALIATSRHAVDAISAEPVLTALPLYCVGAATAERGRWHHFIEVFAAAGDARALIALIERDLPAGSRLLYAAGQPRRPDLEHRLPWRFALTVAETYRSEAETALPETAKTALVCGSLTILHLSRGSGELFLRLAAEAGLTEAAKAARHLALSGEVAGPFRSAGMAVAIAPEPTLDALLGLISPAA